MTISIVVPVYNAGDTISACIESVRRQTMEQWELWLVDDGSTDESGTICDHFSSADSRIHVLHQENKGRSVARYEGVRNSRGEWITFVDADDTLPDTALSLLYEKTSDSTDIVLGNGYTLTTEKRESIPMEEFRHLAVRAEGTIGVPWGSMYRRSVLTPWMFDVSRHIYNGEDYLFWLRLVFATERPVAVVYDSVYNKGEEHTSNSFVWTASYCYELNELRKQSIPSALHAEFLSDMLDDRICNLFAVAICSRRKEWKDSAYYRDIVEDLRRTGRSLSMKQKLFLSLPSLYMRQLISKLMK